MKKYQIIYADPPWRYTGAGKWGIQSAKKVNGKHIAHAIEEKYPTMSVEQLKQLPIEKLADKDCVLFMWTTDSHLPFAIDIMKAWGFEYSTVGFVWNKKEKSGKQVCYMGYWTMKGTELCLMGRRGKIKRKVFNVRQLVEAQRNKHSEKPAIVRDKIVELFGDIPRIELFARQKTEGWDVWGNEVESDIKL